MIYHLVNDEKVINRTVDIFEVVFPTENLFIVFREYEFEHVTRRENVVSYKEYENQNWKFESPSTVIIHFMTDQKIKFADKYIDCHIPIYWVMWGADLYDSLLVPKGYKLIDKESSYSQATRFPFFFKAIVKYPTNLLRIARQMNFINKRVTYLVTSTIEDDYDIITHYYPKLREKRHKEFSYYPIDTVIGKTMEDISVSGNNIQIGNSGTRSNNHEYVLRILSCLEIKDREIILPLSYSGSKKYKTMVIQKGQELFGSKAKAIKDFMPLGDYTKLMASCSIALYGNWRQEAVGNIMVSLYLGAKVFISNKNPILKWAIRHRFIVFELEKMTQDDIDTPLDRIAQENNRDILLRQYDSSTLYESMKCVFNQ